jgi:hypothetical protein
MHGFAAEPGWRHPGLGNLDHGPLAVLENSERLRLGRGP